MRNIKVCFIVSVLVCFAPAHFSIASFTDRHCGDVLGVVTVDEVKAVGKTFVEPIIADPSLVDRAADILFVTAMYDIRVVKLCSSCLDVDQHYGFYKRIPRYHAEYCGLDKFGYQIPQSILVFVPLDATTGKPPEKVNLRAFLTMPSSGVDLESAPTLRWPGSLTSMLNSLQSQNISRAIFQDFMVEFLPGLLAASSGSVAIFPDYVGYGESAAQSNRTIFWPPMYQRTGVVAYLRTKRYMSEISLGCTLLDNAHLTIRGVDDGALGSLWVSLALRLFRVVALQVFVATGPLNLEILLEDAIKTFSGGVAAVSPSHPLYTVLPLTTFGYSSETAGLDNTGKNSRMVSDIYSTQDNVGTNLLAWFTASSPLTDQQITKDIPANLPDILNTKLRSLMQQEIESPCATVPVDDSLYPLCAAIHNSSAWPVIYGATEKLIYPVELCYSDDDELVSTRNFPDNLYDNETGLITRYQGADTIAAFNAEGNHAHIRQICSLSPILFFNLQGHVPANMEDRANYMEPLSADDLALCNSGTYSSDAVPVTSTTSNTEPVSSPVETSNATPMNNMQTSSINESPAPLTNEASAPSTNAVSATSTDERSDSFTILLTPSCTMFGVALAIFLL